jgi:hypothetical protein
LSHIPHKGVLQNLSGKPRSRFEAIYTELELCIPDSIELTVCNDRLGAFSSASACTGIPGNVSYNRRRVIMTEFKALTEAEQLETCAALNELVASRAKNRPDLILETTLE